MKYLLSVLLLFCMATISYGADIGISTGSENGTYFQFGNDIKHLCSTPNMNINIHTSQGSLSNIIRVFADKNTQYSIVQSDALTYQEMRNHTQTDKLKMIFPLYQEEIHIIVRKDANINDINDLNDKRISVGKEGSGNWVTSNVLKSKLGLKWKDVNYDPSTSIDALLIGDIDGMIYVAGKPIKLLEDLPESVGNKIKILSIKNNKNLDKYYVPTMISDGLYKWQKDSVNTYAPIAIMITYNYQSPEKKQEIRQLTSCILHNMNNLQDNFHTKWKEVDPYNYTNVKWESHDVVRDVLKKK